LFWWFAPSLKHFATSIHHLQNGCGWAIIALVSKNAVGCGQFKQLNLATTQRQRKPIAWAIIQGADANPLHQAQKLINPDMIEGFDCWHVE